jgi:hypothetical protein
VGSASSLPTIDFYWTAKERIQTVLLGDQVVCIWDAETLCVFKIFSSQGFGGRGTNSSLARRLLQLRLDACWLVTIFGSREPRLISWDEIVAEVRPGT